MSAPRHPLRVTLRSVLPAAGVLTLAALWAITPSPLRRMVLPAPRFEQVVLSGKEARGRVIDLQGKWFNEGKLTELLIRSERRGQGWERPDGLIVRNGRLRGSIRVMGLGRNGEARAVRQSSLSLGHTGRAQDAAPSGVVLSGLEIVSEHRIPVYLGPGTTGATIENCRFTGWSVSTAIYLDAESAGNVIRDNVFALSVAREVVAVDGSAKNRIEGNAFERPARGGIYLYRNCGEGGTVRHQSPQGNRIAGNWFHLDGLSPWSCGIWLGSRQGRRSYCGADAGYPFGSSLDNRDFADGNLVTGNRFDPPHPRAIRDRGSGNRIEP